MFTSYVNCHIYDPYKARYTVLYNNLYLFVLFNWRIQRCKYASVFFYILFFFLCETHNLIFVFFQQFNVIQFHILFYFLQLIFLQVLKKNMNNKLKKTYGLNNITFSFFFLVKIDGKNNLKGFTIVLFQLSEEYQIIYRNI